MSPKTNWNQLHASSDQETVADSPSQPAARPMQSVGGLPNPQRQAVGAGGATSKSCVTPFVCNLARILNTVYGRVLMAYIWWILVKITAFYIYAIVL